ncbi:MAG TPA: hypothetical protein VFW25_05815 [Silvibacterium sp.]|nr:hypothetical protein [Silvibacterium sp.]
MRSGIGIFVLAIASISGFAQQTTPTQPSSDNKQKQDGKPSAAAANPFPEAASRKAADAANAASASNEKSNGTSSSHIDLKSLDAPAGSESRLSDGAGGFIHDPELAAQDDKVGKFYLQNRDFKGAYARYKEATEVAPEDPDAVFGLAESARGLHRTQEAVNNYQVYLDAFPDGKKAKEARKAVAALVPEQKK